ncbi:MAG: hypothetical protein ACI9QL_002818 [Candidatus Omnitrophota bacterium]|jgi:hypothetical protein
MSNIKLIFIIKHPPITLSTGQKYDLNSNDGQHCDPDKAKHSQYITTWPLGEYIGAGSQKNPALIRIRPGLVKGLG